MTKEQQDQLFSVIVKIRPCLSPEITGATEGETVTRYIAEEVIAQLEVDPDFKPSMVMEDLLQLYSDLEIADYERLMDRAREEEYNSWIDECDPSGGHGLESHI